MAHETVIVLQNVEKQNMKLQKVELKNVKLQKVESYKR